MLVPTLCRMIDTCIARPSYGRSFTQCSGPERQRQPEELTKLHYEASPHSADGAESVYCHDGV